MSTEFNHEDVIELVRAARAWDEEEPPYEGPKHDAVNHRLQAAYRRFTQPYRDDQFAEGIIVSAQMRAGHRGYAVPGGDLPCRDKDNCCD